MFAYKKERDGYAKWMMGNLASGGAAGATSLLFVYSLDYARTRLANDAKSAGKGGSRQFNGLVDVYRKTLATDGVAGLYRGFGPSVLGIVVYRGLYFGMYDSLKPVILVGPLEGNFLASFLLGWGVTTGAGIASYPLDTIRRRMMMTSGEAVKYASSMDAARKIMAAEGVRSFFKGAGANILRGVAGAGVLSIYDRKSLLQKQRIFRANNVFRGSASHVRQGLQGWLWLNCPSDPHEYGFERSRLLPSSYQQSTRDISCDVRRRYLHLIYQEYGEFRCKKCMERRRYRQDSKACKSDEGSYIGFIGIVALRSCTSLCIIVLILPLSLNEWRRFLLITLCALKRSPSDFCPW